MDALKFRAWDGKEMYYKVCINHEQKAIKYGYRATDWVENANAGIPMQFIGIEDVNGKDVYKADIVKCGLNIGVVEYSIDTLSYILRRNNKTFIRLDVIKDSIEVIGNIYQSPELIPVNE